MSSPDSLAGKPEKCPSCKCDCIIPIVILDLPDGQRNKYSTKRQRQLLKTGGGGIRKGMKLREAEAIIEILIQKGWLTKDAVENAWRLEPPTKKQIEYLEDKGIQIPEDATKGQLSDMIDDHMSGVRASKRQREFISELHGRPRLGMSAKNASKYIDYLLDHQPTCPTCGEEFQADDTICSYCGGLLPDTDIIPLPDYLNYLYRPDPANQQSQGRPIGLVTTIKRWISGR